MSTGAKVNMLKADVHRAIDKKNSRHFLPNFFFFGENLQNTNTITLHFFAYWITLSYTYIYCYDWLDRYRKKYEEKLITAALEVELAGSLWLFLQLIQSPSSSSSRELFCYYNTNTNALDLVFLWPCYVYELFSVLLC